MFCYVHLSNHTLCCHLPVKSDFYVVKWGLSIWILNKDIFIFFRHVHHSCSLPSFIKYPFRYFIQKKFCKARIKSLINAKRLVVQPGNRIFGRDAENGCFKEIIYKCCLVFCPYLTKSK